MRTPPNKYSSNAEQEATASVIMPPIYVAILFLFLLAYKLHLASRLDLFGDGAFYWLEAQYPAISYSDVPFVTPLLVKVSTALFGDTVFGVRLPFVLLGSFLPFAVYIAAWPIVGKRDGLVASTFTFLMPFSALFGIIVVPDVPLLIMQVLCLASLERATKLGHMKLWVLTGVFAALAISSHYRFVFFLLAALLYFVFTRNGRSHLRRPGPWVAGAVTTLGVMPILFFNYTNSMAGIAFHFYNRHPWDFDPKGLLFLVEQLGWVSPLIFAGFVLTFIHCIREGFRGSDRHAMMAFFAGTYILTFAVLRPWAVTGMITGHWPLFGYIPLLVFLPQTLRSVARARWWATPAVSWLIPATGAFSVGLLLVVITFEAHYRNFSPNLRYRNIHMLSGWSDVTIVAEQILASKEHETNGVIVADNYYLAVQLAFWSKRKSGIYNLDDEGINQTGRAAQRAIWELDEAGLRRNHAGKNALVVIDTRSIAGGNREVFFERLCGIFEQLHPVLTYGMFGNAWEYKFFIGEGIKSTLAVGRVEHRVTKSSSRVSC